MSGAAGSSANRFVTQNDLSDAQKRREKDIREAYARIGEEPPPAPADETYDPRPLYERLQEAKAMQDEKLEEMFKLRNQFRGLDESESKFLSDILQARKKREEIKRHEEAKELEQFRRCVNTTNNSATETKSAPTPAPLADKTLIPAIPKTRTRTDALAKRKRGRENALGIVRKTSVPPHGLASAVAEPAQLTTTPKDTEVSERAPASDS
ncbi:hypothetical protein MNAN1_000900 [Malassezia nana]|uniref:FAM192A/Fyv6 N-terminal domain-containing protein n=1 Tax=Malassezia nana TaxID=180528 RepID=A0AAF0J1H6_9BASI|nr:hypothetical protein MNAN1_000900 [Malassezia nana]